MVEEVKTYVYRNQAVEDLKLGQYIRAAADAIEYNEDMGTPIKYFTNTCTECGVVWQTAKLSLRLNNGGYVLVGCEGYWLINPEILGLPRGQWEDWTVTNG